MDAKSRNKRVRLYPTRPEIRESSYTWQGQKLESHS